MANNRLGLYCTKCNEFFMIAKHFCDDYSINKSVEAINAFLDKHPWYHECKIELREELGNYQSLTHNEVPNDAHWCSVDELKQDGYLSDESFYESF